MSDRQSRQEQEDQPQQPDQTNQPEQEPGTPDPEVLSRGGDRVTYGATSNPPADAQQQENEEQDANREQRLDPSRREGGLESGGVDEDLAGGSGNEGGGSAPTPTRPTE